MAMADGLPAEATVSVPQITEEELHSFHAAHFSTTQITTYAEQFLGPVEEEEYYEEPDNGLGFYEDGVKRTLTEEQIAMFRHSEIQALLRKRRLAQEAKEFENVEAESASSASVAAEPDAEEGEQLEDESKPTQAGKGKKQSGKKKKSWYKTNVKPDLRKRTWDKVDQGLASLEYGESSAAEPAAKRSMQRKQISYDD